MAATRSEDIQTPKNTQKGIRNNARKTRRKKKHEGHADLYLSGSLLPLFWGPEWLSAPFVIIVVEAVKDHVDTLLS
jgi:hypothetical protein